MFSKQLFLALTCLTLLVSCSKDDSQLMDIEKSVKKDKINPVVNFLSPTNQSAINAVDLVIEVSDNMGLDKIEIFEDGQLIRSSTFNRTNKKEIRAIMSWPYTIGNFDERMIKAVVTDQAGNSSEQSIILYRALI